MDSMQSIEKALNTQIKLKLFLEGKGFEVKPLPNHLVVAQGVIKVPLGGPPDYKTDGYIDYAWTKRLHECIAEFAAPRPESSVAPEAELITTLNLV